MEMFQTVHTSEGGVQLNFVLFPDTDTGIVVVTLSEGWSCSLGQEWKDKYGSSLLLGLSHQCMQPEQGPGCFAVQVNVFLVCFPVSFSPAVKQVASNSPAEHVIHPE